MNRNYHSTATTGRGLRGLDSLLAQIATGEVVAQEASGDSTDVQEDNDRHDQAERCDRSVDAPPK